MLIEEEPWQTRIITTSSSSARARAAQWIEGFQGRFREAGLGQVSEIFDGDAPHTARGCAAQAWSVAELLRAAAAEDVYELKPARRSTAAV
jgi:glycogen debranching enzyme